MGGLEGRGGTRQPKYQYFSDIILFFVQNAGLPRGETGVGPTLGHQANVIDTCDFLPTPQIPSFRKRTATCESLNKCASLKRCAAGLTLTLTRADINRILPLLGCALVLRLRLRFVMSFVVVALVLSLFLALFGLPCGVTGVVVGVAVSLHANSSFCCCCRRTCRCRCPNSVNGLVPLNDVP